LQAQDVPAGMTEDDIKNYSGMDWKALGYITSIVSVFFLGAIAWPKPGEPQWHVAALIVGMATSVLGMGFRYLAHIHQKKEISQAKAKQGR
jgi:hypothetical protein